MLTERTLVDEISWVRGNHIQVRRVTEVVRDGVDVVSSEYHRVAYSEGADLSTEDALVQAIALAAWTGVAPSTPIQQTPSRLVTRAGFVLLFSEAERAAIRLFRAQNTDDQVEDFYELLQFVPDPIDLDHPIVASGLAMLVTKNLLTQDEADRIAAGTPPPSA